MFLGKALMCNYHRGHNYFEINVDIGSSKIFNATLHLALGYVTNVIVDMGYFVEGQAEEELPERLFNAVWSYQLEMSLAIAVEAPTLARGVSCTKVNHHKLGNEDDNWYFEIWTYSFEIWRSKFIQSSNA